MSNDAPGTRRSWKCIIVSMPTLSPGLTVSTGFCALSYQPNCVVSMVAGSRWTCPAAPLAATTVCAGAAAGKPASNVPANMASAVFDRVISPSLVSAPRPLSIVRTKSHGGYAANDRCVRILGIVSNYSAAASLRNRLPLLDRLLLVCEPAGRNALHSGKHGCPAPPTLAVAALFNQTFASRASHLREGVMTRTPRGARASASQAATARAYTSPTLVLLAMDWPAGK